MPWSIVDRWPSLFQNILKSNLRKSARMFWQYCQRNIGRKLAESGFLYFMAFCAHQCSADLHTRVILACWRHSSVSFDVLLHRLQFSCLEFPHDCASWNMLMEYQCNHLHSISDCKPLLCAVLINQNCFDLISKC